MRQKVLPAAKEGGEPLPEGLLWLLLTGDVRSPGVPFCLTSGLCTAQTCWHPLSRRSPQQYAPVPSCQ